MLIEIARRKQERGMLTQFRLYRERQAKAATREGEAAPAAQKRTRAESLANAIGIAAGKIGEIEFPDFSEEDRTMLIEPMNALKETLDEAIPRAVNNTKKPM